MSPVVVGRFLINTRFYSANGSITEQKALTQQSCNKASIALQCTIILVLYSLVATDGTVSELIFIVTGILF
jgi:hypothetical protein